MVCALLSYHLALVQYFLTMSLLFLLRMGMHIKHSCILEVYIYFTFYQGLQLRECLGFEKSLDFCIVLILLKNLGIFEVGLDTVYIMTCPRYGGQIWFE